MGVPSLTRRDKRALLPAVFWSWMRAVSRWFRGDHAAAARGPARSLRRAQQERELVALRAVAARAEQEDRWPQAINAWSAIAARSPHEVPARLRLAELYFGLERGPKALEQLREALSILRRGERHDEYLAVARRVLQHDPADRELSVQAARLALARGEREQAITLLDAHFEARPPDPALLGALAQRGQGPVAALILARASQVLPPGASDVVVHRASAVLRRSSVARPASATPTRTSSSAAAVAPARATLDGDEPTAPICAEALEALVVASHSGPHRGDDPAARAAAEPPDAMGELLASLVWQQDPFTARTRKVAPMVVDLVVGDRSLTS